jgi:hypothetical protein
LNHPENRLRKVSVETLRGKVVATAKLTTGEMVEIPLEEMQ